VYCSKCGGPLTGDAAFCASCGNPVTPLVLAAPDGVNVAPYGGVAGIAQMPGVAYAGFWLRLLAYLVDSVIMSFFVFGAFVAVLALTGFHAVRFSRWGPRPNPEQIVLLVSAVFLFATVALFVTWLYHALMESSERQATWGKAMLGLYVTDLKGKRISFGRASGRHFARIVSNMIPLFIGYVMAGFTERKQALHDMIAGTFVLKH
jgi:uncharacterized RDD family membrane protein YckC